MLKTIQIFTVALVVGLFGLNAQALADDPIYTGTFSNKALKGYDTVSYFQGDGQPIKGLEDFTTEWRGAEWYFSTQDNLDAFKADPEKYAPQYGGYCAWAAGHGSLAKGDPLIFSKIGDKVYLNYDKSIHKDWFPRKDELIGKADVNYPDLVDFE